MVYTLQSTLQMYVPFLNIQSDTKSCEVSKVSKLPCDIIEFVEIS